MPRRPRDLYRGAGEVPSPRISSRRRALGDALDALRVNNRDSISHWCKTDRSSVVVPDRAIYSSLLLTTAHFSSAYR